ncbi:MAG: DUF3306 domain-containing protein [Pseudomonadota bacterium]
MSAPQDFWSRRKAQVEAEAEATDKAEEEAVEAAARAELAEKPDAEILEELGLKDPDTLEAGDDFSVFMNAVVPDRIRRRALRALWRSNPTLANVDGLIDYGQDFTESAMAVENLQTAYQVGKGMLDHVLELARQAEDQTDDEAPEQIPDPVVDAVPDDPPVEVALAEDTAPEPEPPQFEEDLPEDTGLTRRRMRFHFLD